MTQKLEQLRALNQFGDEEQTQNSATGKAQRRKRAAEVSRVLNGELLDAESELKVQAVKRKPKKVAKELKLKEQKKDPKKEAKRAKGLKKSLSLKT